MITSRYDVYEAIDAERKYQDRTWGHTTPSADEFALYVSEYSSRLRAHCTDPKVREASGETEMDFFRKVAALCVAAMELHGAPHR